ncbi:MAG TPA: sigma-70 family RNA polymerase sigma factor [Verrucomicrobiota bacterium]|nr:sigma-70 family RNA polymerase sigma factor [Verrucomicrobiota bacterium]
MTPEEPRPKSSPAEAGDSSADIELVRRAQAGELAAFELLVNRHERHIFSLALRILRQEQDAEDVTQTAFLSALENLAGFRGEASFATWLARIATHAALKVIRKREGLDVVSLDHVMDPPPGGEAIPHPEYIADWRQSPERLAERNETRGLIEAALAELDEKHRLVFLLRDVEGFSVRETAEFMGISEVNVKVRLLRARLQLRERLTKVFGDPARRLAPHRHDGGAASAL